MDLSDCTEMQPVTLDIKNSGQYIFLPTINGTWAHALQSLRGYWDSTAMSCEMTYCLDFNLNTNNVEVCLDKKDKTYYEVVSF